MDFLEVPNIKENPFAIRNYITGESEAEIFAEIYKGLTANQKYISSRFFYDDNGSLLFEKITELPEYYPTRTEKAILRSIASEIMCFTEQLDIIELGSGDCSKISILLDAVPKSKLNIIRYIPVDVSEAAIMKSAGSLAVKYSGLKIHGFLADFMKQLTVLPGEGNRIICFFGSTLGNLTRHQAIQFLTEIKTYMKHGDRLLLGLDMVKDISILNAAYNDQKGITALFNKNILSVMNRFAKTNFNTSLFKHNAFYNSGRSRIEMHLTATEDMTVKSELFPEAILLRKGETIHTENSHKYTFTDIHEFASLTQLNIGKIYTDKNQWFSLVGFTRSENQV